MPLFGEEDAAKRRVCVSLSRKAPLDLAQHPPDHHDQPDDAENEPYRSSHLHLPSLSADDSATGPGRTYGSGGPMSSSRTWIGFASTEVSSDRLEQPSERQGPCHRPSDTTPHSFPNRPKNDQLPDDVFFRLAADALEMADVTGDGPPHRAAAASTQRATGTPRGFSSR